MVYPDFAFETATDSLGYRNFFTGSHNSNCPPCCLFVITQVFSPSFVVAILATASFASNSLIR